MSLTDIHLFDENKNIPPHNDVFSRNNGAMVGVIENTSLPMHNKKTATFFVKRVMDLVISLTALILLSPLLLFVSLIIKYESPGPVLFSQKRWGKDQTQIKVYKFRSMYTDQCDVSGRSQTVKNDSRVTKVGAIIRRTSIDELPQLFNVLKGDMSIVGPRCHPIGMLAAGVPYEDLIKQYHRRHSVKPGLTGLAQVRGFRGPTTDVASARGRILNDLLYIKNQSIWLDIKIIVGTFVTELTGGKGF